MMNEPRVIYNMLVRSSAGNVDTVAETLPRSSLKGYQALTVKSSPPREYIAREKLRAGEKTKMYVVHVQKTRLIDGQLRLLSTKFKIYSVLISGCIRLVLVSARGINEIKSMTARRVGLHIRRACRPEDQLRRLRSA